ncbi:MAG: ATP12 family protein [Hyphomicrobiaceae bacterium]
MSGVGDTNGSGNGARPAAGAGRPVMAKRFYKVAHVSQGDAPFRVLLDGRGVRTPGRREIAFSSLALASLLVSEWEAQRDVIDPATMPATRIVNSALDGVAGRMPEVRADIVAYASHDLVCYRAEGPAKLAARQHARWQPVLDWAAAELGARLTVVAGLMPVKQDGAALAAVERALAPLDPLRLAATHVATTLTGSALLALAVLVGRLDVETAWRAAHVDEDFQSEAWGEDPEASARRERRWQEMRAAAAIMALASPD